MDIHLVTPGLVQAAGSLKDLNKFLNLEDIREDIVTRDDVMSRDGGCDDAVVISGGEFTWDTTRDVSCLNDINLAVPRGELIVMVRLLYFLFDPLALVINKHIVGRI